MSDQTEPMSPEEALKKGLRTFIMKSRLPVRVTHDGRPYVVDVEIDVVSKQGRLFAVDQDALEAGSYQAWLLATAADKATLEAALYRTGIRFNAGHIGAVFFQEMIKVGVAADLLPKDS